MSLPKRMPMMRPFSLNELCTVRAAANWWRRDASASAAYLLQQVHAGPRCTHKESNPEECEEAAEGVFPVHLVSRRASRTTGGPARTYCACGLSRSNTDGLASKTTLRTVETLGLPLGAPETARPLEVMRLMTGRTSTSPRSFTSVLTSCAAPFGSSAVLSFHTCQLPAPFAPSQGEGAHVSCRYVTPSRPCSTTCAVIVVAPVSRLLGVDIPCLARPSCALSLSCPSASDRVLRACVVVAVGELARGR